MIFGAFSFWGCGQMGVKTWGTYSKLATNRTLRISLVSMFPDNIDPEDRWRRFSPPQVINFPGEYSWLYMTSAEGWKLMKNSRQSDRWWFPHNFTSMSPKIIFSLRKDSRQLRLFLTAEGPKMFFQCTRKSLRLFSLSFLKNVRWVHQLTEGFLCHSFFPVFRRPHPLLKPWGGHRHKEVSWHPSEIFELGRSRFFLILFSRGKILSPQQFTWAHKQRGAFYTFPDGQKKSTERNTTCLSNSRRTARRSQTHFWSMCEQMFATDDQFLFVWKICQCATNFDWCLTASSWRQASRALKLQSVAWEICERQRTPGQQALPDLSRWVSTVLHKHCFFRSSCETVCFSKNATRTSPFLRGTYWKKQKRNHRSENWRAEGDASLFNLRQMLPMQTKKLQNLNPTVTNT